MSPKNGRTLLILAVPHVKMAVLVEFQSYFVLKWPYILHFGRTHRETVIVMIGMAIIMLKDEQKTSLLNKLKKQTRPITLPKLLEGLAADLPIRTVRRWVDEWAKRGIVQKTGKKSGTRYFVIHHKPTEAAIVYFSPESTQVIKHIKAPLELRKPVTYHPNWLTEYRPNIDFYLSEMQREKLDEVGNRAKHFKAAGTYARQIYNHLLVDLSYNSSRLEGNTYSLEEAKKLIMEGAATPGKLDEEKTMILNHKAECVSGIETKSCINLTVKLNHNSSLL